LKWVVLAAPLRNREIGVKSKDSTLAVEARTNYEETATGMAKTICGMFRQAGIPIVDDKMAVTVSIDGAAIRLEMNWNDDDPESDDYEDDDDE
jgi:hypothetical protein